MDCQIIQDKLDAYILEALDDEEKQQVEQHIKTCSKCQGLLGETIQTLDDLHALPGIQPSKNFADSILQTQLPTQFQVSKRKRKKKRHLFLVAIFVVFLLGSFPLLVALLRYHVPPKQHFHDIEKAIWQYYTNYQEFPKDIKHLSTLMYPDQSGVPYLPKYFRVNKNGEILDFWGTPVHYLYPGIHNPNHFDLYYSGKNGIDEQGEGDDLCNWRK